MPGLFGGGSSPQEAGYSYGAPDESSPSGGYFTGSQADYFGGSGGGNETGQYAQAIGTGTGALVNLMMGNKQLKMQKRITGIQHQQTREQYKNAMKDSSMNEIGTMGQATRQGYDAQAQLGAGGMGDSSAAQQTKTDMGYQENTRLDAIHRQRALMVSGMGAQEQVWDLQKKMARAQQQSAAISAGIDTAISVASIVSDQRLKRDLESVDVLEVLTRLESLPITTWHYEWEKEGVKHMGPMAQDFHQRFGLGEADQTKPMRIENVDLFGVLIASVKALAIRNRLLQQRVAALERKLPNGH